MRVTANHPGQRAVQQQEPELILMLDHEAEASRFILVVNRLWAALGVSNRAMTETLVMPPRGAYRGDIDTPSVLCRERDSRMSNDPISKFPDPSGKSAEPSQDSQKQTSLSLKNGKAACASRKAMS